jgi:putative lipase involved disintegration of autophagic bodies
MAAVGTTTAILVHDALFSALLSGKEIIARALGDHAAEMGWQGDGHDLYLFGNQDAWNKLLEIAGAALIGMSREDKKTQHFLLIPLCSLIAYILLFSYLCGTFLYILYSGNFF